MRPFGAPSLGALVLLASCAASPTVYELDDFDFTDPAAWRWSDGSLELVGGGSYEPPQRSPREIALLKDVEVGDFDLEVEALQTGRDYGHRDLCVFFGYQDPAHFYYVHLATTPDENACNVFLVDGAPRRRIAPIPDQGVDWGRDAWHRIRIERRIEPGTIRVWFDGVLVLEAIDRTFVRGRLGVGSFDDSGTFRRLNIRGPD